MRPLIDQTIGFATRAWAFVARDFLETISYRLAFVMQIYGVFFSVTLFYFISRVFGDANLAVIGRYGGQYFPYVLVGLAFLGFMNTGINVFAGSIRQGQVTGTLEAMLVTPTSITTIVTASALWSFVRAALNVVLYLAIGLFFGLDLNRANWPAALLLVALSVTAFSGLGIVSASFVIAFKKGNPAGAIFGAMSGLVSGVFFPIEQLPTWVQWLAHLVPLTYALDGTRRTILNGEPLAAIGGDLLALALFTALVLPLAVIVFQTAVRYAKRAGSLAQY